METQCERRGQVEVGIVTELLTHFDEDDARREALSIAEHWSEIDGEDDADPWHGDTGEPDDGDYPDW